jgi:YD repeat-containing protein
VGNRLTRTSTQLAVFAQTSAYDQNDRLKSDTSDANGNTLTSQGSRYGYDFENHLATADGGAVQYRYDGDGNRVAKTVGGVTTRYLVDTNNLTGYAQVVDELVGGNVIRSYTYGHDLISQRQVVNSEWRTSYYGYDGHGSVCLLTDAQGVVTDTYTYEHVWSLRN